jgi:4-hydroxy-2-oxoheptanedioate aldolase
MFENALKAVWADGRQAVGGWATLGSPFATEILAAAGFDYVCIDLQHGLSHFDAMAPMLIATARTGTTPLVRVPFNATPYMGKALDAGAQGLIIPMVNSGEDARAAVSACRYAPAGVRSFGPVRASLFAAGMSTGEVNAQVLCLPMVETRGAVDRIEEICSTPGVDGIYIGPADLAITYGLPPYGDPAPTRLVEAIERIRSCAAQHGLPVGIHTGGGSHTRHYLDAGFDMVTVSTDAALLRATVLSELAAARGAGEAASAGIY